MDDGPACRARGGRRPGSGRPAGRRLGPEEGARILCARAAGVRWKTIGRELGAGRTALWEAMFDFANRIALEARSARAALSGAMGPLNPLSLFKTPKVETPSPPPSKEDPEVDARRSAERLAAIRSMGARGTTRAGAFGDLGAAPVQRKQATGV